MIVPRHFVAMAFAGAAAGCSAFGLPYQPIEEPRPVTIADFSAIFQPFATGKIQTGSDYVWAGYSYVDYQCNTFFTALAKARIQNAFLKDTTSQTFATANTILAIAKVAQNSIGIVSAAGSFATATLANYSNDFYFSQHSGAVWLQVSTIMSDYKRDKQAEFLAVSGGSLSSPTVAFAAHNLVQNYARLCSLQQIDLIIQTALTAAPAQKSSGGSHDTPLPSGRGIQRKGFARTGAPDTVVPTGAPVYAIPPGR